MATATTQRDSLSREDYFEVCKSLKVLKNEELIELGTALGLDYTNLKRMKDLPGDMVHAWLNGMDYVLKKSGLPSWTSLVLALENISQGRVAFTIRKDHEVIVSSDSASQPTSQTKAEEYQKKAEEYQKKAEEYQKKAEEYQKKAEEYKSELEMMEKKAEGNQKKAEEYKSKLKMMEKKVEEYKRKLEMIGKVSQQKIKEHQRELIAKEQAIQRLQITHKKKSMPFFENGYKILLLGETGSGKTSLLKLICSYAHLEELGCTFDEDGFEKLQRFDPELEDEVNHSIESRANGAKLYDVVSVSTDSADLTTRKADLNKLEFCVIDTPGFGDTRGFDRDKENLQKILDCIKEEKYINCVCIVINGRQTRITVNLQYVLTGIASILPTPVLDKILFVFTNVPSPLDLTFDPTELKIYFGEQVDTTAYICINNPYSEFQRAIKYKKKRKIKNEHRVQQGLKRSFNETRKSLKEMCHMMKFEIVHAQDFICLHLIRQVIEGCVSDLLLEYNNQKELKKEITAAQEDGAETLKQKLEVQLKYSEAKRQKLSVQLLKKIEEFEKLSVGRNYVKLIKSQIEIIKLRIRGSTGSEVQDLIKIMEQLDEKLKVLYKTLGISIQ